VVHNPHYQQATGDSCLQSVAGLRAKVCDRVQCALGVVVSRLSDLLDHTFRRFA
jgi:hypothetical protein